MSVATKIEKDWVEETIEHLPMLLTIAETARVLRMSERQVWRLASAGRLMMVNKGGKGSSRVVPRGSLERYLRSLEVA